MAPLASTTLERTVFATPHVRLVEIEGALRLEKTALDSRDGWRILSISLLILWAVVAALSLIDAIPHDTLAGVTHLFGFPLFIMLYVAYSHLVVWYIISYRGRLVSVMRKSLWIGRLNKAGDEGYRDAGAQQPALVLDGRPIAAERLVRVAVGEIDLMLRVGGTHTVNLVLIDGIVLVAHFNEPEPAIELAAQLTGAIGNACDPAVRGVLISGWSERQEWRDSISAEIVVLVVPLVEIIFLMVLVSLLPVRETIAGALLVHLAIRHFVILKIARRRVEQSLLRAVGPPSSS